MYHKQFIKIFHFLIIFNYFDIPILGKNIKVIKKNKTIVKDKKNNNSKTLNSNKINIENSKTYFNLKTLADISSDSRIRIEKCSEEIFFNTTPFPLSSKFPYQGKFNQPYILFIDKGRVTQALGMIFLEDTMIKDLVRAGEDQDNLVKKPNSKIISYYERIAVITQAGVGTYYHWINEVLGRLALLEMFDVTYDKLYVPLWHSFMKETLIDLWGIDSTKIINSTGGNVFLEADTLIVPSLINKIDSQKAYAGNYIYPECVKYVREKLLLAAKNKVDFNSYNFSKKVFISRKDAHNARRILNEDEVFELFREKGFERYHLNTMSVLEQIILFNNADIVVCEHGSGLTNIIFCKPKTKIIEIFQALIPIDYWWSSQIFDLDYIPLQTISNDVDYFANMIDPVPLKEAWSMQMNIPLNVIKKIIDTI